MRSQMLYTLAQIHTRGHTTQHAAELGQKKKQRDREAEANQKNEF